MVWSSKFSNRSVVPAETEQKHEIDFILARLSPLCLLNFRWMMGSAGDFLLLLLLIPIMVKDRAAIVVVESTIRISGHISRLCKGFFTGVEGVLLWLIVMLLHHQLCFLIVGIELPIRSMAFLAIVNI
jgi:uncharacterized membrane protein